MPSYSVAQAKNNLPKLLDRMLAGEQVVITRRGKPIARLEPEATRHVGFAIDPDWLDTHRVKPAAGPIKGIGRRRDAKRLPLLTVYLDTSVVVPLFVEDDHSLRARAWARLGRTVALSPWTLAEFSSAMSMQVRMKRYTPDERREIEAAFDAWAGRGRLLDFDVAQSTQARLMLRRHGRLRAPDALHLVVAKAYGLEMATLDEVLKDAALAEGLRVAAL